MQMRLLMGRRVIDHEQAFYETSGPFKAACSVLPLSFGTDRMLIIGFIYVSSKTLRTKFLFKLGATQVKE